MSIGPAEIIVVLLIALLIFGPKQLPQMGRSLGRGVREFRKAAETAKEELGLGEVSDQINEVKESIAGPIRDFTNTVSEPLDEVKGTFGELKKSVDVKAAIEAPVAAGAAGAAAGAASPAIAVPSPPLGAIDEGPETPAVTPATVFADVTPVEAPAAPEPPEGHEAAAPNTETAAVAGDGEQES